MKVKIYGCRSSIPLSNNPASKYGGNTSCITLKTRGQTIILDAGSGISQMDRLTKIFADKESRFDILISHLHLDTIIGLTVFGNDRMSYQDNFMKIYTINRDSRPLKKQIFGLFAPPYWTVSMEDELVNAECIEIEEEVPFRLDYFTITPFIAAHPDKTTSFHITDGNITVLYLLDSETSTLSDKGWGLLVKHCKNADLVIFGATYPNMLHSEKKHKKHPTIEDGFKLAKDSGCKKMMFTHFDAKYSDQELETFEVCATAQGDKFFFARDNMELSL